MIKSPEKLISFMTILISNYRIIMNKIFFCGFLFLISLLPACVATENHYNASREYVSFDYKIGDRVQLVRDTALYKKSADINAFYFLKTVSNSDIITYAGIRENDSVSVTVNGNTTGWIDIFFIEKKANSDAGQESVSGQNHNNKYEEPEDNNIGDRIQLTREASMFKKNGTTNTHYYYKSVNSSDIIIYDGIREGDWLSITVNGNDTGWIDIYFIEKITSTDAAGKSVSGQNYHNLNEALEDRFYSIFSDQGDHFKELVQEEKPFLASQLYEKEIEFFNNEDKAEKLKHEIDYVIDEVQQVYEGKFMSCNQRLTNISSQNCDFKWADFENTKNECQDLIKKYSNVLILKSSNNTISSLIELQDVLDGFCFQLNDIARECFPHYDHFSRNSNFFTDYPCDIDKGALFKENQSIFHTDEGEISSQKILTFLENYENLGTYSPELQSYLMNQLFLIIPKEVKKSNPSKTPFEVDMETNMQLSYAKAVVATNSTLTKEHKNAEAITLDITIPMVPIYRSAIALKDSPKDNILITAPKYSRIKAVEYDGGDFVKVDYDNQIGWINIDYIEPSQLSQIQSNFNVLNLPRKAAPVPFKSIAFIQLLEADGSSKPVDLGTYYKRGKEWVKVTSINRKDIANSELFSIIQQYDYALIISNPTENISKKMVSKNRVQSKYKSDVRFDPNPQYQIAKAQYEAALYEYEIKKAQKKYRQGSSNWGIIIGNALIDTGDAMKVDRYRGNLQNTPISIERPIYTNYAFEEFKFDIIKNIEIPTYLIDTKRIKVYKKSIFRSDNSTFTMENGLRNDDENYNASSYDEESDLKIFTEKSNNLQLAEILKNHYKLGKPTAFTPSLAFLKNPNSSAKKKDSKIAKRRDSQIISLARSVVAIQSQSNDTIGTGFFVRSNYIVTNRHVVNDKDIISLKMIDGKQFLGRVIDRHFDLDIALIKIDGEGRPVTFMSDDVAQLGDDVIAIGHPMGFEYSVTKGIISAIREKKDSKIPLSEYHKFIQTDVAINPGNSGGPLFRDGKVVGMNTLKMVDENLEGMGFAIHYDEILKYLNKELL